MTEIEMTKPVYRQNAGYAPNELPFWPVYTSSLGLRCDFCGQPAKTEVLILPEFDVRLAGEDCEWRENVTFIDDEDDDWALWAWEV